MEYQPLYIKMVDATERAIEALDQHKAESAKQILLDAQLACEELYLQSTERTSPSS